jgi:hypothetical protein
MGVILTYRALTSPMLNWLIYELESNAPSLTSRRAHARINQRNSSGELQFKGGHVDMCAGTGHAAFRSYAGLGERRS